MRVYSEDEIQDLTDRVFLLRDRLEGGKIKFAPHLIDGFRMSFEAIRLRPDGRVDPSTVDGRIRASTLAIKAFAHRDETKEAISLTKIQSIYFDFLFKEFSFLYDLMGRGKATPSQAAAVFVKDEHIVNQLQNSLPDIAEGLKEFWLSVAEPAEFHLQDGKQLKATFSGDLFPAHWENVVSTAGLYIDTIVLPCPVMRIAPLLNALEPKHVAELFIKHVLTAMSYRELATADVEPPLVLISPNPKDLDTSQRSELVESSSPLSCRHGSYLFGRDFESTDHLMEFCGDLITIDQVIAELRGKDRLIFDADWGNDPRVQLQRTMDKDKVPGLDPSVAGNYVLFACVGRMPQALATQQLANHFGGTPFIGAETSWKYFNWMLEYQGQRKNLAQADHESMHIVRALSAEANNNLQWLGNVPPATVLQIRKAGLAEELRSILGQGISDLISIRPDNYFRTADQVVDNLDRAFRAHQASIREARTKKLKLYGIDVATCVAAGGIGIAAALTGSVGLGVLGSALGVVGLPNLKDIKTKYSALTAEEDARKCSPTGMLFKHIKN